MILIRRVPIIIFLATLIFIISGCKKGNPNPELLDPIYKDIVKEHKRLESELKDKIKKNISLKKEFKLVEARSMDRVVLKRDLKQSNDKIVILKQRIKYLGIRMERRRVEGRRSYKIAFKKGEKWPDPKEYEQYLLNKKLNSISLNWNKRVPKLHQNNPNYGKVKPKDSSK